MEPHRISAIRTTGIYCVPGCPARPLERNRRRFHHAEAAEQQGFRACLRCRPDREPALVSAVGSPPLVELALRAIAQRGGEAGIEVGDLADSLGVEPAKLRALFDEYVGTSPHALVHRRRTGAARLLLEQTDLPPSIVAHGVGFDSAAELNEAATATFRFGADELRRRRFAAERRSASVGPTIRLTLSYWNERDVSGVLEYLKGRAIPGVEQVVDGVYQRTIRSRSGRPTWVAVEPGHMRRPNDDCGHLTLTVGDVSILDGRGELLDVITSCRNLFGLDDGGGASVLVADPVLGPLVQRQPGLRLAGAWDRFETAVRIVLGQQVTVAAASTLAGRLALRFGTSHEHLPAGLHVAFPTPQALAEADLSAMGMPKARGQTVVNLARAVLAGDVDMNAVGTIDRIVGPLRAVRGIGPWTAQLIAARVYRQPDAFPPKDLGLERAWADLGGSGSVDHAAQRWAPYQASAIAYLWMYA